MCALPSSYSKSLQSRPQSFIEYGQLYLTRNQTVVDLALDSSQLALDLYVPILRSRPDLELYDLGYMAAKNEHAFFDLAASFFASKLRHESADKTHFFSVESDLPLLYERTALAFCDPGDLILVAPTIPTAYTNQFHLSQAIFEVIDPANLAAPPPVAAKILLLDSATASQPLIDWALQNPQIQIFVDQSWAPLRGPATPVGDRVHAFFALHKYFGTNGIPMSLVYTHDAKVLLAFKYALGAFRTSSYTEWLYKKILAPDVIAEVERVLPERLSEARGYAAEAFAAEGIAFRAVPESVYGEVDVGAAVGDVGFARRLLEENGVFVVPASEVGGGGTPGRVLVNLARPLEDLKSGIARVIAGVKEVTV
jgi:hypothetical protein